MLLCINCLTKEESYNKIIANDKVSQIEVIYKMPKETFYHLTIEKRQRIEKALENELGRDSFEKASISKIIQEANIPRGSFYQYFEDKEDAIKYIIEKYRILEKETIQSILQETKGDIFEASLKIFDDITSKMNSSSKNRLYKNIMQELKKNNINLFHYINIDEFIDTSILNIKEESELESIMKIITSITRIAAINVNNEIMAVREAREELQKQIEILKRGMKK